MAEKSKRLAFITKIGVVIYFTIAIVLTMLTFFKKTEKIGQTSKDVILAPELARAMTYEQFEEGSDDVYSTDGETKVDNVKFSAFFLRDLDGDGYAEKMKGTCRETGAQDTLYMEINVLTNGKLTNAKVEIDGKNFYLQTALPRDQQIKNNVIGANVKYIEFNDIVNGTQKLLTGAVRSGDYSYSSSKLNAIGNNINNYTRTDNKVILTGTYVDENNNETPIRKEIPLTVDWYGTTKTIIENAYQNYYNLQQKADEDNQTIAFDFYVRTTETENKLLLSNNHIDVTIPQFNGCNPSEVIVTSGNVEYEYDETTKILSINRIAATDETGKLTKTLARDNTYNITVKYPLQAYEEWQDSTIELLFPVAEYYEGYNNQNTEFTNPYKSNIAKTILRAVFNKGAGGEGDTISVRVGEYISKPYGNYVVSKRKPMRIYNAVSSEEKDDTYKVRWYYHKGANQNQEKITLKETPANTAQKTDEFLDVEGTYTLMEDLTTNAGIYFNDLTSIMAEDGEIKVYDDEQGTLLLTIDKTSFLKYTSLRPYYYETPVKHIRVEVTGMNSQRELYVYNIKELDDEYITTNYTEEEFQDLKQIKSNLVAYRGESEIGNVDHNALYEIPTSVATINLTPSAISTQETEKNEKIIITAEYEESKNEIGWRDGIFLIKLPDEILKTEINSVTVNNNTIEIDSYEYKETENGKFIKIYTSNITPQSYIITINCNLTADPRIPTSNRDIELYAHNEEATDYYYKSEDTYDVNNNNNTQEKINKQTAVISMVSPNSLLTNQTLSEFDNEGTVIVSPSTADISIKSTSVETEEKTAKIGVQLNNNYISTISEVLILGKIPFEGNKTALTNQDLGSTFTTKMKEGGITAPAQIADGITIYYSENENPTKDINDEANGWKPAEDIQNWDNIKTYLIDFEETKINPREEYVFYYTVKIPSGVNYNEVSYSHHGVYFALDTDEGKYKTKTEPNKIGIRIAEKYNLNLTKYQKSKEKQVAEATYSITDEDGTTRTETTNTNGELQFTKLYVEKTYEIKEIRTPEDYELNGEAIKFIAHVNKTSGEIEIEKISGTTKGDITISNIQTPTANIQTEDEARATLKIKKQNSQTHENIKSVKYKLTGEDLPTTGRILTTNVEGEATLKGLKIGAEYTLEETKARGYYLNESLKFKIVNENGEYQIQLYNETSKQYVASLPNITTTLTENDSIPIITLGLVDDPIPTYNLQIKKVESGTNTTLQGAKFTLYKEGKAQGTYETDEKGLVTIQNLYQYESDRDINQTYILKEVYAPDGYAKTTDVTFSAQTVESQLRLDEIIAENTKAHAYAIENNTITLTIEDKPSFKLTKKDGETSQLLPNTKFAIYNIEGKEQPARDSKNEIVGTKEIINGHEYYLIATDENGQIKVNLPEGLYKAVEVVASDEKYSITNNTKYFGIGKSREGKTEPKTEWGTGIGGSYEDQVTSVAKTDDGGYLLGGYFKSSSIDLGNGNSINNHGSIYYTDGMIIKYNSEGASEWGISIGGSDNDRINSITETTDGGYLVGGFFHSSSINLGNGKQISNHGDTYNNDAMLIKYDTEGKCEWGLSIGGTSREEIKSVIETEDGGYLVGGWFNSSSIDLGNGKQISNHGSSSNDGMLIKYNSQGICEWGLSIGGNSAENIYSVTQTKDGGYLVGGDLQTRTVDLGNGKQISNNGSTYNTDGMLIKYNRQGECEWGLSIGDDDDERINSVTETADGGYLVGGYFDSSSVDLGNGKQIRRNGSYSGDGMLIKYSRERECEWGVCIGGSDDDEVFSVIETKDGSYLVGGNFRNNITLGNEKSLVNHGSAGSDGMVIKYSKQGECQWGVSIGGSDGDYINSVTETEDGGYVAGGYFGSSSIDLGNGEQITKNGSSDGIAIKIKEEQVQEIVAKQGISIGGNSDEQVTVVAKTSDGGHLIGGHFLNTIDLGNGEQLSSHGTYYCDAMLIKYNKEGKCVWKLAIGAGGRR